MEMVKHAVWLETPVPGLLFVDERCETPRASVITSRFIQSDCFRSNHTTQFGDATCVSARSLQCWKSHWYQCVGGFFFGLFTMAHHCTWEFCRNDHRSKGR
jgi:hypothetical protein